MRTGYMKEYARIFGFDEEHLAKRVEDMRQRIICVQRRNDARKIGTFLEKFSYK